MNGLVKKMEQLFGNEEFAARFEKISEVEEIKTLANEYGVELSDEEVAEMVKAPVEAEGELNEEDMDAVAGGILGTLIGIAFASWSLAVKTYGSPSKAVKAIGLFWARKLGYKG